MNTVKFDGYDSYDDFDLLLTSKEIGAPTPKSETVDVPGSDGTLDLTEFFGEVFYKNRELSFEFSCIVPQSDFLSTYSNFKNKVHGRKMEIRLTDDPGFYYVGRVTVNEWKTDKTIGLLSVDVDCEPYKYKDGETTETFSVSGSTVKQFSNLKKRVVPKFNFTAAMEVQFGDSTYNAAAGNWSDPGVTFEAGENTVTFEGTGTVTVTYQERGL